MTSKLLTLACSLALTATAYADGHFKRDLPTGTAPDVYVLSDSGSIHVHPGTDSSVHIEAHLHAGGGWHLLGNRDTQDVEDRIRRIVDNPPIQQNGNSIHIGQTASSDRLYRDIAIDYDITAPVHTALNLQTGSGDLAVEQLGRYLKAVSGSGSIRAHQVHGPAELRTGSGDIDLEQSAPGGDVSAQSGSGSLRLHGLQGKLVARTGSGDIDADGIISGPASLRSGSGSVRLHMQPDAHFDVQASTGSGSIHVNYANAPQQNRDDRHEVDGPVNGGGPLVRVSTGSGDIEIGPR